MSTAARAHTTSTGSVLGPEVGVAGLGGIFNKLMNEHGEAVRLIARVIAAHGAEARANLYPALRTALLAHERTETSTLYATLRRYPATQAIVSSHEREARHLETVIGALDALEISSSAWLPQLQGLSDMLQQHIREEEDDFFPAALTAIGASVSEDLRVEYLRAKPGIVNSIEADALHIAGVSIAR